MKFSIITVCRNAESTIERTIRSIISQTYPSKEFIVIDGKSTDGTKNILKKYEHQINIFVSEPDNGIYDAMNKGVKKASGDYLIFMNADDYFFDNAVLQHAAEVPPADFLFGGQYDFIDGKLKKAQNLEALNAYRLFRGFFAHQAIFAKRSLWERFGLFDLNYKICADRDWLLRCFVGGKMTTSRIKYPIAVYSVGGESDRQKDLLREERKTLLEKNLGKLRTEKALLRFEKIFRNLLKKTHLHKTFLNFMEKRMLEKYPTESLT